jgi:TolB-like protein
LAVLEFQGLKLDADVLNTFSDAVRGGAAEGLQANNTKVMTRENMMVLLREMGKTDCVEGDCEVETARSIGADFVISGLVVHIETSYVVTLKLHETKDGGLLATDTVQAPTQLEMLVQLREHGQKLVAKKILPLPADEGKVSVLKPVGEPP